MKKVTIGGNRLGSGKKMKVTQRSFDRSTDNLSTIVRTSAAPGVLYPIYNYPMLPGDTIDIDLESIARTKPTVGPLFGSFKEQVDLFFCPMRLYQGIMHDNPVNIGMEMDKVILPKIILYENMETAKKPYASNSLLRYLGITGFGTVTGTDLTPVGRKFEAVDFLAYYDIFKNYYANKQEPNAKVIVGEITKNNTFVYTVENTQTSQTIDGGAINPNSSTTWVAIADGVLPKETGTFVTITTKNAIPDAENIIKNGSLWVSENKTTNNQKKVSVSSVMVGSYGVQEQIARPYYRYKIKLNGTTYKWLAGIDMESFEPSSKGIALEDFELKNIDSMRRKCLASNQPGSEFIVNTLMYPYGVTAKAQVGSNESNFLPMNGLVVKTYQNDILNNWINKEWIDGKGVDGNGNPISFITRVDTSAGYFTMDTLNMAQKLYNNMIQIAVGDGTIRAWQSATYNVDGYGLSEIPVYIGGMSGEIVFEEVVSQSETETEASGNSPIGTLAGKGTMVGKKGGKITYRADEPGIVMAILSLTPRIDYSQGNKWHVSEINTMDDFHKPALDGIGFQELIAENAHWAATVIDADNQEEGIGDVQKLSVGKTPAWQWYRTDINRTYGDFAEEGEAMFMTLNRRYEANEYGQITDFTAYIDPIKYNYCFADTALTAQNFWIQIKFDIKMRHFMSARNVLPFMR